MLMVALYQEKLYAETALVLDDLIRLNPGKEDYWQQQASVYQIMEQQALALRTLELGYAAGHIKKTRQYSAAGAAADQRKTCPSAPAAFCNST